MDLGRERLTEPLLECPQQRLADEVEVLGMHPVPDVAGPQPNQERRDVVDVAEPIDGGLDRCHRPARLECDVVAEQGSRLGRQREDPLVEQHAGDLGDRQHMLERGLNEFDLGGGDAGAPGVSGV